MYDDDDDEFEHYAEDDDEFDDDESSDDDNTTEDEESLYDYLESENEEPEDAGDDGYPWFTDSRPRESSGGGGGGGGGSLPGPPQRRDDEHSSWSAVDISELVAARGEGARARLPSTLARDDGFCLFYSSTVSSLYGESESAKSLIAQLAAVQIINDGLHNFGRVAYIDYESDAPTVINRLIALGADPEWIENRFEYFQPKEPQDMAHRDWQMFLHDYWTVVIIDGVTEALSVSEISSSDNDQVAGWMKRVPKRIAQETGAAVILIDHVTKSNDARNRFAIGAQAKMASLDGVAYKVKPIRQPVPGGRGSVRLSVTKDRPGSVRANSDKHNPATDGSMATAVITFDSTENPDVIKTQVLSWDSKATTTGPIADDVAEEREDSLPVVMMERISETIARHDGISKTKAAKETSGKQNTKFEALAILLEQGFIREEDGKLYTVTRYPDPGEPVAESAQ